MSGETRGLMFRPEMVRAILNGSKTQTRRLIKKRVLNPLRPTFGGFRSWPIEALPLLRRVA